MQSSICVASALRSVAISRLGTDNLEWDYIPVLFWGFVEISAAAVCSCLPAMSPLNQAVSNALRDPVSRNRASIQSSISRSLSRQSEPKRPFSRLNEQSPMVCPRTASFGSTSGRILRPIRESKVLSLHAIHISADGILEMTDKEIMV